MWPWRVTGRGVDLQRADPVAGGERARRPGLRARIAAARLRVLRLAGVGALVLGQQARVARGDQDLDAGQRLRQRVEGADVVAVRVGEGDAHDRRPDALRRREDLLVAARHHRVDEREPVVLLHEIGVDEPELGDAMNGHRP
jgi:hypothetical protein